jgi:molybdenum cofactor cytidylyltransferase
MDRPLNLAAVVLAAGAGSRYSDEPGAKLLVGIGGRPMLARVLDEVRRAAPASTVVVLGRGAQRIETTIEWAGELRVDNPDPDRGLASSLKVGIDTLRAMPQSFDGAFIVLGDQPLLRAEVLDALTRAAALARPAERPMVVPRYAPGEGARNPVLLLRPAWDWVDGLDGDRGLAAIIQSRPEAVLEVPVGGSMPDVDAPTDLERLGG